MEIPRIIYEQSLKSVDKALLLKNSLDSEFSMSQLKCDSQMRPSLPLIIKEKQYKELKKTSEMFFQIMDKTIGLIIEKKNTGKYIRTYKALWELVERENTCNLSNIMFSKISGVYDKNDTVRYFEFNSEPESFLLSEELLHIYGNVHKLSDIFKDINFSFFNKSWKSFSKFLQICDKKKDFIALIPSETGYGDKVYYKFLKNKGFNVIIAKPEEFSFYGEELIAQGNKIKLLIFPHAVKDINSFQTTMKPVIDAYEEGHVYIIDTLRSFIASEKSLFALISDRQNHHFYNSREVKFIKKHIPWTRIIRHEHTTDIDGNEVDLIDYIIEKQDRLVLKKSSNIIGEQLGPAYNMNSMDWKTLISWILSSKELWIVQEKIEFNSAERYEIDNDSIILKKIFWCVNPYIFNGKFQTCYGRTSTEPVVNTGSTETLVGFI